MVLTWYGHALQARELRDAICRDMRLAGESRSVAESKIEEAYLAWLTAEADDTEVAEDAAQAGSGSVMGDFTGEGRSIAQAAPIQPVRQHDAAPRPDSAPGLTLGGFEAACAKVLAEVAPADEPEHARQTRLVDGFRRFDVDGSGDLSLADLKAVLLDDAPSAWFDKPGQSSSLRLKKATSQLAGLGRLVGRRRR